MEVDSQDEAPVSITIHFKEDLFDSGFNNIANFNRQFKEVTEMSPREYRMKYGSYIV